jgi:hypothetical protein
VWGAVQWCATRAYRDCVIANMRLVQCGAWPLECPFPLGLPCLPALPACALCVHFVACVSGASPHAHSECAPHTGPAVAGHPHTRRIRNTPLCGHIYRRTLCACLSRRLFASALSPSWSPVDIQHLISPSHVPTLRAVRLFWPQTLHPQPNKRTATMTMMRSTIQALALAAMTALCSAQTPPLPNLPPSFEAWVTCNIVDKNCTLAHSPPRRTL